MILLLFAVVLLLLFGHFKWKRQKLSALSKALPGPDGWPILGMGLSFFGVDKKDIINVMKELVQPYSNQPFRFWMGPLLIVASDNPDDLQIVTNSPNSINKDTTYQLFEKYFDVHVPGLIAANGDLWKNHRKLLNPCFAKKILESYTPIFNRTSRVMIDVMESHASNGGAFNVEKYIHRCSLDQIVGTTFGIEINCLTNEDNEFLLASDEVLGSVTKRILNFWLQSDFIYEKTAQQKLHRRSCSILRRYCEMVLSKVTNDTAAQYDEDDAPKTFVNQLLGISKSGGNLTDNEIMSEMLTMVLAGNETSAVGLSNTILLLAMHPHYQDQVVAELKKVLDGQSGDVTNEQLNQLVFSKQVINESMRLLYIVPFVGRQVTGDVALSNGVVLPAGCTFIIPIFSVHTRKDLWGDDADQFRPERFDANVERHPYQFLPFSGGTRICIGYKYAYMSMLTMLAYLLRNYEFSTDLTLANLERTFNVTMILEKGHLVRVKKRNW